MEIEKILYLKELKENNSMSLEDYKNSEFADNQIVGLQEEEGEITKVSIFSAEALSAQDLKYADVKEQFKEMQFYIQKISNDFIITTEDNLALLEKHEEMKTRKQMIEGKNTRKSINSVKGADGRSIR